MKVDLIILCIVFVLNSCETSDNWQKRITELNGLSTIQKECYKYSSDLNRNNNIIQLGKDTTVATNYYSIILYPKITSRSLNEMERKYSLKIPYPYKQFLTQMNGAFFKDISLYGIPSTFVESGLVNRQELEPLNLISANDTWKKELDVDFDVFLIGSSSYNDSTNINYCYRNNKIVGYLDTGVEVNSWDTIDDMLGSELSRISNNSRK